MTRFGMLGSILLMRLLQPRLCPLLLLAVLGCGGSTPSEPVRVTISLGADRIGLLEGESTQLTATVQRDGIAWPDAPVTWRSESPLIASVDATGRVTATLIGGTRVLASVGTESAAIDVSVISACRIDGISLSVASVRLRVNESVQVTGKVRCDSSSSPMFSWRSTDSLVARVDSAGRITARGTGTAIVTATLASDATRSAAMRVDVEP